MGDETLAPTFTAVADDRYDLTGMIRPGLWETTTREVSADGALGEADTDRDCITEEDLQDFSNMVRGQDDQRVTVEELERGDDYVSYQMGFASDEPDTDAKGELSGEMKFEGPESYQGTMTFSMSFQGQAFESTTRVDARRIGECSGDDEDDYEDDYLEE